MVNYQILISTIVIVLGWFIVNQLNSTRDRENKLRDIKIEYLINAYHNLANSSMRKPSSGYFRQMESAVADIQLFGTPSQISKVHQFLKEFSKDGKASMDPLLDDLRNELRDELNLPRIEENVQWFRPEGAPKLEQVGAIRDSTPK
jgi:hypothetical protein